jgi:hypothetical protein
MELSDFTVFFLRLFALKILGLEFSIFLICLNFFFNIKEKLWFKPIEV